MALANLNTADFIQGSGVSQTGNVIDVTGGGGGALDDLTDVTITAPSDGEVLTYDNVTGEWVNAAPTGGGGTPGGSDTEVQFNDGGTFNGITGATTDGTILNVTTANPGTNTTQAASTEFVQQEMYGLNSYIANKTSLYLFNAY